MCITAIAINFHPKYKFVLIFNRDEDVKRLATEMDFVDNIYSGKDLDAGGTWLGVSAAGKFAALTNYWNLARQDVKASLPSQEQETVSTRGAIPMGILTESDSVESIFGKRDQFKPFNLISGDFNGEIQYLCHKGLGFEGSVSKIEDGVHCVSNTDIDAPLNKVQFLKQRLIEFIQTKEDFSPEEVMELLMDDVKHGFPMPIKEYASSIFILPIFRELGEDSYTAATVSSTAIMVGHDNSVQILQRTWEGHKEIKSERRFEFSIQVQNNQAQDNLHNLLFN